jgi:hypothetical protein
MQRLNFLRYGITLCLVFYFTLLGQNLFAQPTPPGVTASKDQCKGTITIKFAAWYANVGGEDTEMNSGFKVYIKESGNTHNIWTGDFFSGANNTCNGDCGGCDSSNTGDGGEDMSNGWDCGQYIRWDTHGSWRVYNYGGGAKSNNNGTVFDEQVLDGSKTEDSWFTYELEFGPIPQSWYDGRALTIEVDGTFDGNLQYTESAPTNVSFTGMPVPSGLSASSAFVGGKCNEIDLSWSNPNESCNIDYEIQYRSPGSSWTALTTITDQNTTDYTHTGLDPGEEYEYRIRTALAEGVQSTKPKSAFSDAGEGGTIPRPEAPIGFTASTDKCDNTIDLNWQYNPGNGSGELEGFRIYRNGSLIVSPSANDRFFTDSDDNLIRGTNYTYTVRALNECGLGAASDEATGYSPRDPVPPGSVSTNVVPGQGIRISWPNGQFTSEYKVERNLLGGGGSTILIPSPSDAPNTLLDESIIPCQTYEYRVIAINDCKPEGVVSQAKADGKLVPDLSNTFEGTDLLAAKGFFSERVELGWTVENNVNIINAFKVYRRDLSNQGEDFIQIASLNSGSNLYVDDLVDAAKLYEYAIVGEAQCEQTTVYSDTIKGIGFRTPFGTITGNVTYSGGTAVGGVKISAASTAQIEGHSVELDGNSTLEIAYKSSLDLENELAVEMWYKPSTYSEDFSLIKHTDVYDLRYNQSNNRYEFEVYYNTGTPKMVVFGADEVALDNYHHIAAQVYEDSVKVFVDGVVKVSEFITTGLSLDNSSETITIGDGFKGILTELRVWSDGRPDATVIRDASRHLVGGEAGLRVYLKTIEGTGNFTYDGSKINGNFNRNHARFVGDVQWSDDIPTISQLGNVAYTDASGNYILNVPYNGIGENFVLTPSFGTHEFDPETRALFIGDGATIQNGIDFLDKSSFTVSGSVSYVEGGDDLSQSCIVPGVTLKIDGQIVVNAEGQPMKTDDDGEFTIQVPIGFHVITVEKAGHVFSVGRFPSLPDERYNFQEDKAGLKFRDSTLVKVVGRVVGGLREGNKIPGLGKSKNNIGQAEIVLASTQGNGCYTKTITTDIETGEYIVEVPPLKYNPTVRIISNPVISFTPLAQVDLSVTPVELTEYDSTFSPVDGELTGVDSITYNKRLDYIHRVNPKIIVTGIDGVSDFMGDSVYTYIVTETSDTIIRNLKSNPLRWPVFRQQDEDFVYECLIKVFEEYINLDNSKTDSVPTTDGKLRINNQLSHYPELELPLNGVTDIDTLKNIVYYFKPGIPNFTTNLSIPDYSFTQKFEINLITENNTAIPWYPVKDEDVPMPGGDKIFRGYLLGGQSNGDQFFTLGPKVPEYVLRDPPGSNSSATREIGTTLSKENSWQWTLGGAGNTEDHLFVGAKFSTGIGVSVENEIANDNTFGVSSEIVGGRNGTHKVVTTNTQSWNTNSSTDLPGTGSDVYIGKSKNVQFGIAEYLSIIPKSECDRIGGCLFDIDEEYSMGKKFGLSIVPGGFETNFQFSQSTLELYEIPSLKNLRNIILQTNPKYTSYLPVDDPNYGKNNDDPVFGNDIESNSFETLSGPSYTYAAESLQDSLTGDSVRFFNEQIKQWEDAIALNEWEKVNIDNASVRDSIKTLELEKLEEKYGEVVEKYEDLNLASTVSTSAALAPTLLPIGASIIGYAAFGVTTGTEIEKYKIVKEYEEYKEQKDRIEEKFSQSTPINHTFDGGGTYTNSVTHQSASTYTKTIEYNMSASFNFELTAKTNNTGAGVTRSVSLDFNSGRDWSESTDTESTISFTLDDPDQGDKLTVDVYSSILGWGPIFKKRGGRTSCPYEGLDTTRYYQPGTVIGDDTQQRDRPDIDIAPSILTNIPVDEPAVFTLTLFNNSEDNSPRLYNVSLSSTSNSFGALVSIDGTSPNISVSIPGGSSVTKTIAVRKGPGSTYNYDNLKFIIYAPCQYDAGTSDNYDIVEEVSFSAHFLPTCSDVSLADPEEQWVLNNSNKDTLNASIIDYNLNFFDFKKLRFEYKPANVSDWVILQEFHKFDSTLLNQPDIVFISQDIPFTLYDWDVKQITDGYYDLRVVSECALAEKESIVYSGIMDRINPHPFGNPSPADGILSPNDEISIKFNEPIDLGALTINNFDIRGVTNGTEKDHSTSLYFDGSDDYMEMIGGAPLRNRDFTISFAAKRNGSGEEAIITQGTDEKESIFIGFNDNNEFEFRIGTQKVASSTSYTADGKWRYYAVSYDFETENAELFVIEQGTTNPLVNSGNTTINGDYKGSGKLIIGKSSFGDNLFFDGNVHEIAIWSTPLSADEFSVASGKILSGSELGLLFNWRMDEAEGIIAEENVRRRDATIFGATWTVDPSGSAASFDGVDDYLKIETGDVVITDGMDFTLEFWFNSTQTGAATLFSNGTADGMQADSLLSWNIDKDASGRIIVRNYGIEFVAVEDNFFDGQWHHFALVLQRTGNISAYIDGNLQNSVQATPFKQLGGSHMYLGARGYQLPGNETIEQYYQGAMDEFRFWNASRKIEQIQRDKRHRLMADELGLSLYMPFEDYELDPTNVPILTASFDEQVDTSHTVENPNMVMLSDQTPTIKLQRPVQSIAFTYSVNNDEIIFTPTTSPELIENVTLDITVKNVRDLQGNVMESPKTWIAYMDKNQVVWQDDLLEFEKEVGEELTFTSAILNQGGAAKEYEIKNVPDWLTVTPNAGLIPPNSVKNIDFEVDPLMNIGDYVQDIQLLTDFNFAEKLTIDLKVRAKAPDWNVDPEDYENSMGVIGALRINEVISTDEEDMLAAFVGDEVRGVNFLRYVPDLDRYLVFLDVYSNDNFGEEITFKVWDASEGIIYTEVDPEFIPFTANNLIGTTSSPQIFSTSSKISVDVELKEGWNWVSNFLLNPDSTDLDVTLESINAQTGDEIKGLREFSNYSSGNGWRGPLNNVGIRPEQLYKLKVAEEGILRWEGDIIDPTTRPITLNTNWNWIGFISIRNQPIAQAFGNLNAADGDLVKGRSQFAVYDSQLGWIGSLETLVPGYGYMYRSAGENSFTYPVAGMFRNNPETPEDLILEQWPVDYGAYATNMTAIASWNNDCNLFITEGDFAIGVFDPNDNCRGVSLLDIDEPDQLHYLTIGGSGIETLNTKLLNINTGIAYPMQEQLEYRSNAHLGNAKHPVQLSFSAEVCDNIQMDVNPPADLFHMYPSIFDQHITLEYTAENDDDDATVTIYNVWGQLVYETTFELKKGFNRIPIILDDHSISVGSYFSVLKTNGITEHQKLIKQ